MGQGLAWARLLRLPNHFTAIADVLAVPEAERLGWEEMESLGVVDALEGAEEPRSLGGGMIAAPRLRRRQRAVSSRAMFFSGPRG
jgi:hypothetical protein